MDDVFIAPVRDEAGDETTEGGARVAERGERVGFCRDEVDESEARVFITKELSGDEANTELQKISNRWHDDRVPDDRALHHLGRIHRLLVSSRSPSRRSVSMTADALDGDEVNQIPSSINIG